MPQKNQTKKGPVAPVYVPKKNQGPEVVNLEASSSKDRNIDDLNLENMINAELEKIASVQQDGKSNDSKHQTKDSIEDSESSNEFVDATQMGKEVLDSEKNASSS